MKNGSIIFILLIIFSECENKEPVQPIYWQKDKSFKYSQSYLFNSIATDSFLFINGPRLFGAKDLNNNTNIFSQDFVLYPDINDYIKFPISKNYFFEYWSKDKQIVLSKSPKIYHGYNYYFSTKSFSLYKYDSLIESFALNLNYRVLFRNFLGINDNAVCIPVRKSNTDSALVLLINFSNSIPYVTKIPAYPDEHILGFYDGTNEVYSSDQYFLVATYRGIIKINNNGTYKYYSLSTPTKNIYGFIYKFFKHNNKIYGVTNNNDLMSSNDEGETWLYELELNSSTNPFLQFSQFYSANGRLFAYYLDKIHEIKFEKDSTISIPLNCSGLEGYLITSLAYFNNKLWATTLQGLLYIDISKI